MTPVELENIIEALAPELAGCYVLIGNNTPAAGIRSELEGRILGVFRRDLASIGRPELESTNRWRGIRSAIWINIAAIREANKALPPAERRLFDWATILGVLLHESGHVLDAGCVTVEPPEKDLTELRSSFDKWVMAPLKRRTDPPWFLHEKSWIRCSIHLAYRGRRRLLPVPAIGVVDTVRYGLSSVEKYESALGNEPSTMMNLPFKTILSTAPPAAFIELWKKDTSRPRATDTAPADHTELLHGERK